MTHDSLKRVNAEIAHEKAAALGRAGERLEAALEEVRALIPLMGGAAEAGERARLEAVGFRQHRIVDQLFPEPAPRTLT